MGCVSSNLLNHDDDFPELTTTSAFTHHIVSLTSTTYGLLNLDPPPPPAATTPPPPPPRFSLFPETINSWDLMSGLDADSFRFSPLPPASSSDSVRFQPPKFSTETVKIGSETAKMRSETEKVGPETAHMGTKAEKFFAGCDICPSPSQDSAGSEFGDGTKIFKENSNPNIAAAHCGAGGRSKMGAGIDIFRINSNPTIAAAHRGSGGGAGDPRLEKFEELCPPNGEDKIVIYTTSLRGIRKTYEACNAVRAAIEGAGVMVNERDVSMDRGFREELRDLMKGKEKEEMIPPRVFVRGRYVGGAEEVMRMVEEGWFMEVLDGLPRKRAGEICEGCGNVRFLPCFSCSGSSKLVMVVKEKRGRSVVVRCPDCNENGLVLCPICS